jgi:hypothetical protein
LLHRQSPTFQDHVHGLAAGEHRQPADDRASEEIRIPFLADSIAGAAHAAIVAGNRVSGKDVPKQEFGNEK